MTPNVVGVVNNIPQGSIYSGGKPALAAFVELKLPGTALATQEAKQAVTEGATNIVYAADGSWGISGHAHSNADLGAAIQRSANP